MSRILHLVGLGSGNESISWSNARQKIRELVKEMGCDILELHCSYGSCTNDFCIWNDFRIIMFFLE